LRRIASKCGSRGHPLLRDRRTINRSNDSRSRDDKRQSSRDRLNE